MILPFTVLGAIAAKAQAAGPPIVPTGQVWSSAVSSTSARLQAQINPNGLSTTYHFDYITAAAYDANLAASKDPFAGSKKAPAGSDSSIGSGTSLVGVIQFLSGLTPATAYRYRLLAVNSDPGSPTTSSTLSFTTLPTAGGPTLLDSRGWEMVSPIDKNGGEVAAPGVLFGGGVAAAAAGGGAFTYGSETSFGAEAGGAPPASQYVSTRSPGGWSTQNVSTASVFSGTYDTVDQGVPYQLFSPDLAHALLLNGDHCRGDAAGCAVANPPLAGSGAPAGYQDYYLRDNGTGGFEALLGAANAGFLDIAPADFDLSFAGSSADLSHVVVSTCAALTADAVEAPFGSGCDPTKQNLYEWSSGQGLSLVNLLPNDSTGTPGAVLGAQAGAISDNGDRVYWSDTATGNLYLREAGQTKQVDADAGGGGKFLTASSDGSIAFFSHSPLHLWRYDDATGHATDLTPSGGGVLLGTSASGDTAYFRGGSGLEQWHNGTTTQIAAGSNAADPSDFPPATGTARVSADGNEFLFLSSAYGLTGYDNTDQASPALCGQPSGVCDSEVYLYANGSLSCLSCNPTGQRPLGPSTIPGAVPNGTAPGSTDLYKPRVLSADGKRVFFDSRDALALADTDNAPDVYEWEAQGAGSCVSAGGCLSLVSSGRSQGGASFLDASADGSDAFFLTAGSLVKKYNSNGVLVDADLGGADVYDARVDGGFPLTSPPIACEGDACQPLPPQPSDPALNTLQPGLGNPPLRYVNAKKKAKRCKKGFVKRKGRCVRKHKKKKKAHHKRHGKRRHKRGGRR